MEELKTDDILRMAYSSKEEPILGRKLDEEVEEKIKEEIKDDRLLRSEDK